MNFGMITLLIKNFQGLNALLYLGIVFPCYTEIMIDNFIICTAFGKRLFSTVI